MSDPQSFSIALLSLPLISALIGWVTNYIAIKMLFHPRRPLRIGPFTLQGILPRRQADIAVQLGHIVATDLLSSDDLIERLGSEQSRAVYEAFFDQQADHFIREKLYYAIPMSRLFLGTKTLDRIKAAVVDELMEALPEMINRLTDPETGPLNVQQLVEKRVLGFSTDRLERLLHEILAKEFRFIEILGAVLGFIIGVAQMLWIVLML